MKLIAAAVMAACAALAPAMAHDFAFGADLSFANEMDDCGARYRDGGKQQDVYAIFKAHGTTLVRIRLWNDPTWTKYSTLADVERSIRRAKAQGLSVLLDFQYSDDWADGEKQIIPAAWAGIKGDDALADTLYRYTRDTLTTLGKEGLMPDMVQVGNETNGEILMPAPPAPGQQINWVRNAKLINAGIKAVRDAGAAMGAKPKVMLHIAQPENAEPWFAAATAAGVTDFDVIGISYYSKWSKQTIAGLGATINRLRFRYPRAEVMVAETAYAWTTGWRDNTTNLLGEDSALPGYPVTKDGQLKYMTALTQAIIANGGAGVIYWAPDWVSTACRTRWGQGSSWENATLFDFDGEALPAIDYPHAAYQWPVTVTFRFHGLTPPAGHPFYLWGDFLGSKEFAVRLPETGDPITFSTALMPGQNIRFQVFDGLSLHARLISGKDVIQGFASETVPGRDTVYDLDLAMPAGTGASQ